MHSVKEALTYYFYYEIDWISKIMFCFVWGCGECVRDVFIQFSESWHGILLNYVIKNSMIDYTVGSQNEPLQLYLPIF